MDSAPNGRPTRPRSRVARAIPSDAIELQEQVEQLMAHLRLAVIFGGDKISPGSVVYQSSNTRPWKSYEAVAQDIAGSLERIGFRNVQLMPDDMRLALQNYQASCDEPASPASTNLRYGPSNLPA